MRDGRCGREPTTREDRREDAMTTLETMMNDVYLVLR
jgi:hypothetical protein